MMTEATRKGTSSFPVRVLVRLSGWRYIAWYIAILGLGMSLLFSFVIFPGASESLHMLLDPDLHGNLAYGLWQYHTFSYYPDTSPSVERGPLYPAFMAFLLWISHDWHPYVVQLAQAFLLALISGMVFWTSERLWSRPAAVLTAGVCAVHPVAIWYTGRIWIETMSMFLFTAIMAGTLYFTLKPSVKRALVLGVILGASALCKSTFLPYAALAPFCLWLLKRDRARFGLSAISFAFAILIVAPWTIRNWKVTGQFIPVHTRMGYNLEVGDEIADHIRTSPLALCGVWDAAIEVVNQKIAVMPEDLQRYQRELWLNSELMKVSMERYRRHPAFMLKKIAVNAWLFWTLGATVGRTIGIGAMMLMLVLLMVISSFVVRRRGGMRGIMGVHLAFILVYYGMHLPVEAIARYSVVLVPAMIMYGIGPITQLILDRKQ
jgi:4-amino-4-deoxy-L-arabinose transferase-like glycosyltransferase